MLDRRKSRLGLLNILVHDTRSILVHDTTLSLGVLGGEHVHVAGLGGDWEDEMMLPLRNHEKKMFPLRTILRRPDLFDPASAGRE